MEKKNDLAVNITKVDDNEIGVIDTVDHAGVDQAFDYAVDTMGMQLDPIIEKKVLRKIDLNILPIMCALMSCQLMDKASNSYASITGLLDDLHMTGTEYSWVGSSFYLGYLVFEFPANLILQKLPLSKVVSTAAITWGVVICCHGACKSTPTFLLCRTILGMLEAFMAPAYMILTAQWYRREEQYVRSACWLGFQGFGTMMGSGIAAGLYRHAQNGYHYSMATWRLMYIIIGVITIFFGLISIVHIPDLPMKARFLNDLEKKYVVERVRNNRTGFGNQKFKWNQMTEALSDVTTYVFFFFMIGYGIPNSGIGNFGSILLKDSLGFDTYHALLMNMVGSGIDIIFPLLFALLNLYFIPKRLVVCGMITSLNFMALCLLAWGPNKGSQTAGWSISFLTTASWACMSSVMSSNIAGHSKKAVANALFLIGFSAGNIIGPQAWLAREAPNYTTAKAVMVGTYVPSFLAPFILLVIYLRRNKKRDRAGKINEGFNSEFTDLTDKTNPEFRYAL